MFEKIPGFANFLVWERQSKDTIDFKKVYVDMAGDLLAGLLLSQVVFWYLPDKNGGNKLRVQREGEFWIAKKREDWWDEVRMAPREVDRALERLRRAGIVETRVWKFDGKPTTHVRVLPEGFMKALNAVVKGGRTRPKDVFTRDGRRGRKSEAASPQPGPEAPLSHMCNNGGIHTSDISLSHMCDNQEITHVGIPNHESVISLTETSSEITKENIQTDLAPPSGRGKRQRQEKRPQQGKAEAPREAAEPEEAWRAAYRSLPDRERQRWGARATAQAAGHGLQASNVPAISRLARELFKEHFREQAAQEHAGREQRGEGGAD